MQRDKEKVAEIMRQKQQQGKLNTTNQQKTPTTRHKNALTKSGFRPLFPFFNDLRKHKYKCQDPGILTQHLKLAEDKRKAEAAKAGSSGDAPKKK